MRQDLIDIVQAYIPVLESTNTDICKFYIQGAGDEDIEIRVKFELVKSDNDWSVKIKRYDAVGQLLTERDLGWLRRETVFVHDNV